MLARSLTALRKVGSSVVDASTGQVVPPNMFRAAQKSLTDPKTKGMTPVGSIEEAALVKPFKKAVQEYEERTGQKIPKQGLIPFMEFVRRESPNLGKMLDSPDKNTFNTGLRILKLLGEPVRAGGVGPKGGPLKKKDINIFADAFVNAPGRDKIIAESAAARKLGPNESWTLVDRTNPMKAFSGIPDRILNRRYDLVAQRNPKALKDLKDGLNKLNEAMDRAVRPKGKLVNTYNRTFKGERRQLTLNDLRREVTAKTEGTLPVIKKEPGRTRAHKSDPFVSTEDDVTTRQGLVALGRKDPEAYRKIEEKVIVDLNKFNKKFPLGKETNSAQAAQEEIEKIFKRPFYKNSEANRQLFMDKIPASRGIPDDFHSYTTLQKLQKQQSGGRRSAGEEQSYRKYDSGGDYIDVSGAEETFAFGEKGQGSGIRAGLPNFPIRSGMIDVKNYVRDTYDAGDAQRIMRILDGPTYEMVDLKRTSMFQKLVDEVGKDEAQKLRTMAGNVNLIPF